jgi:hypothetical protein
VSGGSIPERPRLLPQLGVGGYAALGHRRLHAQHPRVRVGRVRDYRDLEQVQLEQIVDAAALAGLERDVAEAERDGIVLHRPPRLAGDLAVVKVELALDVQPQVYLARAGRIDWADHVRGVAAMIPMERDPFSARLPLRDRLLERARDDPVLDPVDRVRRSDGGELAAIRDLWHCGLYD